MKKSEKISRKDFLRKSTIGLGALFVGLSQEISLRKKI